VTSRTTESGRGNTTRDGGNYSMTSRTRHMIVAVGLLACIASSVGQAFERSKHVDPNDFAEPPKEYRQQAWLTYNLSRATEENMAAQVKRWAEQDLTGGFYLGLGGGSTAGLSQEYLQGAGRGG